MTTPRLVACYQRRCKWFRGIIGPSEDPLFVCEAFPKGIPEPILAGEVDHTEPYPGDDGIQYAKQED